MNISSSEHRMTMTIVAILLVLSVTFVPCIQSDLADGAADDYYSYTIHTDGTMEGDYTPIGSSSQGEYTSVDGTNSGSWAFDEDGYGPFNSFYAAFDPARDNRMVCHLDPDDLTRSTDGESIVGKGYNVMWCLPTVYWYTDSDGSLVLTNDPGAGGTAYAHTIEGHAYNYIGIGVYEASKQTIGGQTILTSFTDSTPTVNQTRATFRDQANNQLVNTTGNGNNGYAMLWNFYQWELYKYCALAVMGSWDSQSVAGKGNVYGGDYIHTTGDHDSSGPYAGTKDYLQDPVKVFIENPWGGAYDFVDGVIIRDGEYYLDQSAVPTDSEIGTYITNPIDTLPSYGGWGSDPSIEATIWGMPTAVGVSNDLYDRVSVDTGSGPYVIAVGGFSNETSSFASNYGLSHADCGNKLSYSSTYTGSRLTFVFNSDPTVNNIVTFEHGDLTSAGGNAGSLISSALVPRGESFELPDFGDVDGCEHIGWIIEGEFYNTGDIYLPTGDITATSIWQAAQVRITFVVEDQTYSTLLIPKGSTGIVYTPQIVEGIFEGWYYDPQFQNEFDPAVPIMNDISLYAKGVPPLTFTTDPVANGDIVAIEGLPGTVTFRATDSEDFTSVLWDFGDGHTSRDLYATHYYSEPGTYTATLTVYNNHGSDVTTYTIEVPSAEPDDGIEWTLIVTVAIVALIAGALIARRLL